MAAWQMQCCGTPFKVGDDVTWTLIEGSDRRSLSEVLGPQLAGEVTHVEEHHGRRGTLEDIRIAGDLSTGVELFCARCLEPVVHNIQRDFDLLYRPQGADAGVKEAAVQGTEAEISYYTGEGLLLEDVLREQVLL